MKVDTLIKNERYPTRDDLKEISAVYKLTCAANGKSYIGKSTAVDYRIKNHLWQLRANRHYNKALQDDFNLFGEDSFSVELLGYDIGSYRTTGFSLERKYQEVLKTYLPEFGYNSRDGYWRHGYHLERLML